MFALASLLFCVLAVRAQSEYQRWSVTPRIGINSSNISNKADEIITVQGPYVKVDTERKAGLIIGADLEYRYSRLFSTTLGGYYSDEGYKDSSYKQVKGALLQNFHLLPGLAVKAGLQLGYLASMADPWDNNWISETNRWNLSIPVGISYEYWRVSVDLRYDIGITDFKGYKFDSNDPCHSNSFWLTIGYRIPLCLK